MQFHIEYEGKLPSQNAKDRKARRRGCHLIRESFHHQLRQLWNTRFRPFAGLPPCDDSSYEELQSKYLEANSLQIDDTDLRFFPVINEAAHLVCALDITLYRHQAPGSFVGPGGDLDNHLKVLFDALSTPNQSQVEGLDLGQAERPIFCLMQDDAQIIDVRMKTVQIWRPYNSPNEQREVKVSVDVKASCTSFQGGYGGIAFPDL